MEDKLKKELVAVQVNGTPAHLPPEYRDMVSPAIIQIYLLLGILVVPDTYVRRCRGDQRKGLVPQLGQGMIDQLRFVPGDLAKVIQIHHGFSYKWDALPQNIAFF